MTPKQFQKKVKAHIKKGGRCSKERLAVAANVSARTIDEITTKGRFPRPSNLIAILKAIGEPLPKGLTGEDSPPDRAA